MIMHEMEISLGVRDQQWKAFVARFCDPRRHIKICRWLTATLSLSHCAPRLDSTSLPCSCALAASPRIPVLLQLPLASLMFLGHRCSPSSSAGHLAYFCLLFFRNSFVPWLCSPMQSLNLTRGIKSSCTAGTVLCPLTVLRPPVLGVGLRGGRCSWWTWSVVYQIAVISPSARGVGRGRREGTLRSG